jgi:hypothetical protein
MPITADEQITPDSRRGRCIAPIADVSALDGGSDVPVKLLIPINGPYGLSDPICFLAFNQFIHPCW